MLGYGTLLTLVPESQLAVTVLTNRDAEAGGPVTLPKRVTDLVLSRLPSSAILAQPLELAARPGDYTALAGDYTYGVYCRSCSAAERARGSWSAGRPKVVTAFDRG